MVDLGNSYLSLQTLTSQFLECPLCFEHYLHPKVLPCQHTFCLECLKSYVATNGFNPRISCPVCKEKIIIPGNDVRNFKNNFFIVSLLHFVKDSEKNTPKNESTSSTGTSSSESLSLCGACGESEALSAFCQACSLELCCTCTKAHGRLPATSSHDLLTSQQLDSQCKATVGLGKAVLDEFQQIITSHHEFLQAQMYQLPDNIAVVRRRIESAAEEAFHIIKEKANILLQQVDRFHTEQNEQLCQKLARIEGNKQQLTEIEKLLESVHLSDNGFKNQASIKQVERYIANTADINYSSELGKVLNLSFNVLSNNLVDMKNLELGQMRIVTMNNTNSQRFHGRSLQLQKVVSLIERDYISALAINKFAEKFVVANNSTVLLFKPDSMMPKLFLTQPLERTVKKPWGIAFCEEKKCIFVSEAGRNEGDGAVTAYSLRGKYDSTIASGLTLPRGIAVHKSQIFVCDQIDKCVYVLSLSGKVVRVLKKTPDGKYLFDSPMFVSVGRTGVIAVSDNFNSIKVLDKDFVLKFTYTSTLPECQFWDVLVLADETIIACDWKHGLHKISPDFKENGLIVTENAILREPSALAALENGNSFYIGTCGGEIFSAI